MKKTVGALFLFLLVFSADVFAQSMQSGRRIQDGQYETTGQVHYFVTPSGTGDCTSWDNPCTFRSAVAKTSSTVHDVIHLGAGTHDTDNGSDATGTTISANYVAVVGTCTTREKAHVANADAAATYNLTITGDHFTISNIEFNNEGQADTEVVHLYFNGASMGTVRHCEFYQATGSDGDGIIIGGGSTRIHIENNKFLGLKGCGIETNNAQSIFIEDNFVCQAATGLHLTHASDQYIISRRNFFGKNTTGIHIDNASITDTLWEDIQFCDNTTNINDGGDYGGSHWFDLRSSYLAEKTYPTGVGTSIDTGDGAWTWTAAATTIVAASTITKPFLVTGINIQSYDASQTFKIEILYGEATANISLGIFEFTVGASAANQHVNVGLTPKGGFIPQDSIIGAKLMSSTAGVDSVTITISYQEL